MELKLSMTTLSLLLLLILAVPCFSRGGVYVQEVDSGIYDIDYRGPETHSYLPPPDRSKVKLTSNGERVMAHSRSKGLGADNSGGSSEKKHQG